MITLYAYAKINLTLEVLGKRSDGYHEVMTVLQAIDLKDTLTFEPQRGIDIECDNPELKSPQNLAVKAARLLQEASGCSKGALIHLSKGIPEAAGLGGGSSDAAATLQALNRLWQLGLAREQLLSLAARLGSDVPFFLYGGTALGTGRGEIVTPLPPFRPSWLVLFRPPVAVPGDKTRRLYGNLSHSYFTNGAFSQDMIDLLKRQSTVSSSSLFNVFEKVASEAFPGLEDHWRHFRELGAANVHLAGSGPTLFSLVENEAEGKRLYRSLRTEGLEVYLVETVAGS